MTKSWAPFEYHKKIGELLTVRSHSRHFRLWKCEKAHSNQEKGAAISMGRFVGKYSALCAIVFIGRVGYDESMEGNGEHGEGALSK